MYQGWVNFISERFLAGHLILNDQGKKVFLSSVELAYLYIR